MKVLRARINSSMGHTWSPGPGLPTSGIDTSLILGLQGQNMLMFDSGSSSDWGQSFGLEPWSLDLE